MLPRWAVPNAVSIKVLAWRPFAPVQPGPPMRLAGPEVTATRFRLLVVPGLGCVPASTPSRSSAGSGLTGHRNSRTAHGLGATRAARDA